MRYKVRSSIVAAFCSVLVIGIIAVMLRLGTGQALDGNGATQQRAHQRNDAKRLRSHPSRFSDRSISTCLLPHPLSSF